MLHRLGGRPNLTTVFNYTFILFQSVWDNMKRRTVEKADKAAKSGAGGVILTKVDNLVLDAIGKDGAYLKGVGRAAPYPSFSGVTRPTDQGVEANGDSSLNVSAISNWNHSFSQDNIPNFDNFGADHYDPPALRVLDNQARNSSSTVTRPPSPFQFTAPFDRQRPQASSTPFPRPISQDPAPTQLPGQLSDQPELTERPGIYGL